LKKLDEKKIEESFRKKSKSMWIITLVTFFFLIKKFISIQKSKYIQGDQRSNLPSGQKQQKENLS
jgi:hypothetical protein